MKNDFVSTTLLQKQARIATESERLSFNHIDNFSSHSSHLRSSSISFAVTMTTTAAAAKIIKTAFIFVHPMTLLKSERKKKTKIYKNIQSNIRVSRKSGTVCLSITFKLYYNLCM